MMIVYFYSLRRFSYIGGSYDNIIEYYFFISGEKAPLGRILRNFRLCMRTPFQGNPLLGHVTFGHFG